MDSSGLAKKLAKCKHKLFGTGENYIETVVRNLFRSQGRLVGKYPIWFLVVPLIICGVLCTGMFRMKKTLDVTHLYTPTNARANHESRVAQEYFEDDNGIFVMKTVIYARDGGNLLRSRQYIDDVLQLIQFTTSNFTVNSLTFNDIRENHDRENDILVTFLKLYSSMRMSNDSHERRKFRFGFPVLDMGTTKLCLAGYIAGVDLDPQDQQILGIERVYVRYRSAWGNNSHAEKIHDWETKFIEPDAVYKSKTLNFISVSDRLMSMEMQKNGLSIQKFTILSFCALTLFSVLTSTSRDCVTSKPWEAFCGIASTLLSVGTSYGIIFYAGYPFLPLLLVAPVLVLALGLDVTFIVIRSWQTTDSTLSIPDRLAETMAESGPSVVITSLTNILSAGVGAMTNTMAVHLFCLNVMISVILLFFLQITFFAATIALGGRRENAKKHAIFFWRPVVTKNSRQCRKIKPTDNVKTGRDHDHANGSITVNGSVPAFTAVTTPNLHTETEVVDKNPLGRTVSYNEKKEVSRKSRENYPVKRQLSRTTSHHVDKKDWWFYFSKKLAKLECTIYCRIFVTGLMAIYWTIAIWGCTQLKLGLTMEKLFLTDSIMVKYFSMDNGGLHDAIKVYFFVSNAPNFSIPQQRQKFDNLVNDLENLPFSWGNVTTELWLKAYDEFYENSDWLPGDDEEENDVVGNFYANLPEFMEDSAGERWRHYMFVTDHKDFVRKFIFSTTYHPAKSWGERTDYTRMWRDVVDRYPEFNVSIWDDDDENYITDQLESIPGNTIQDIIVTGVSMAIICILFIPNVFNTLCAMITIFSINVGVFGFLVHWDVSLDPISMASLLMAIGFSVDFTSHISFHYYTSEGKDQYEKLSSALASIGFPMIQSGTATVLSIACVCFVKSYMVWIFFKTVFLVVAFGLLHGLIVLPTYLAWLPLNLFQCSSNCEKEDEKNNSAISKNNNNNKNGVKINFTDNGNVPVDILPTIDGLMNKPDIVRNLHVNDDNSSSSNFTEHL